MKEKFIRLNDKICAIWHILQCKEFALFTCEHFNNSKGSTCTISLGIDEDKEKELKEIARYKERMERELMEKQSDSD